MRITAEALIDKLQLACPDIDGSKISAEASFKKLALDSMDIASFMLEVEESYGIKIPNAEISKLDSIDQVLAYLQVKSA